MPSVVARSQTGKWIEFGAVGLGIVWVAYHVNLSTLALGQSLGASLKAIYQSAAMRSTPSPAAANAGTPSAVGPVNTGNMASQESGYAGDMSITGANNAQNAQDAAQQAAGSASSGYWGVTPGGQPYPATSGPTPF